MRTASYLRNRLGHGGTCTKDGLQHGAQRHAGGWCHRNRGWRWHRPAGGGGGKRESVCRQPAARASRDAGLDWGASPGGLLGAKAGAVTSPIPAASKENWLSALVRDAIASGQTVLVVDAKRAQEAVTAREVIQASVGDYKEVHAV